MTNKNKKELYMQKSEVFFAKIKENLTKIHNYKEKEIVFYFTYRSFIRIGIVLMKALDYKIKCEDDFDKVVINKLAKILKKEYIQTIGQKMRQRINETCYGIDNISKKETIQYLKFVNKVFIEAKKYFY